MMYCMEPELSLLYIILKKKFKILKSIKSGKTDFKYCNLISRI